MKYAITLDPAIAKVRNWTGVRRRECTFENGRKEILLFGRKPVMLDELPPEVAADARLIVTEVREPDRASEAGDYDDGILENPVPSPDKKGDRVQKSSAAHKGKK